MDIELSCSHQVTQGTSHGAKAVGQREGLAHSAEKLGGNLNETVQAVGAISDPKGTLRDYGSTRHIAG